ncbi:unnamed protein product [Citrullus colocynthis]|uniref:Uncharacterized protein n=1 Tax=Citrullus colocynthis TaxID=252529 RepID=A0ABP0Y4E1_9ROSI
MFGSLLIQILALVLLPLIFSPISWFSGNIFSGSKTVFEGTLRSKSEAFFFFIASPSFLPIDDDSQIAFLLAALLCLP